MSNSLDSSLAHQISNQEGRGSWIKTRKWLQNRATCENKVKFTICLWTGKVPFEAVIQVQSVFVVNMNITWSKSLIVIINHTIILIIRSHPFQALQTPFFVPLLNRSIQGNSTILRHALVDRTTALIYNADKLVHKENTTPAEQQLTYRAPHKFNLPSIVIL